ncbi:hypothetical protein SipoB123_45660 [Streptomyces ipomoeae]|nr:hypothetical protein SipoB123_45660 [Streptomyces ipomoeae]
MGCWAVRVVCGWSRPPQSTGCPQVFRGAGNCATSPRPPAHAQQRRPPELVGGRRSGAAPPRGRETPADSPIADCRRVIDAIGAQGALSARAGIGEPATSVAALHDSYQDARDAPHLTTRGVGGSPVQPIRDLRVHQVLAAVGRPARTRLLELTAAELRAQPDWPVLHDTITAWCESCFRLVRASAALHVHRKTVVHRTHKIEQLTGRPLSDPGTTASPREQHRAHGPASQTGRRPCAPRKQDREENKVTFDPSTARLVGCPSIRA